MYSLAILAGGLASRLGEVTRKIPKSLIEIAGKPFIFHQLEMLSSQGIKNVVLCLGHLGDMIESRVGNGTNFNLNIKYSYDGQKQLGTGGSLKKALPFLGENFFVLYGDSFLPISFKKVEKAYNANSVDKLGLMTIIYNENLWDKSNVLFHRNNLIKYNKKNIDSEMKYIDYGLSILNKRVFDFSPCDDTFDLSDTLSLLAERKQLIGFEVYDRFYEIGSKAGIQETEEFLINFKLGQIL